MFNPLLEFPCSAKVVPNEKKKKIKTIQATVSLMCSHATNPVQSCVTFYCGLEYSRCIKPTFMRGHTKSHCPPVPVEQSKSRMNFEHRDHFSLKISVLDRYMCAKIPQMKFLALGPSPTDAFDIITFSQLSCSKPEWCWNDAHLPIRIFLKKTELVGELCHLKILHVFFGPRSAITSTTDSRRPPYSNGVDAE